MDLFERMERPTPKFFRRLRNIGIGISSIGGAIVTAPIPLPALVIQTAGYFIVAGTVASVVSQMVINDSNDDDDPMLDGISVIEPNPLLDANR